MLRGLIRTGLGIAGLRGINALLGFGVLLILSHALGPAGLGAYALCLTILSIAAIPVGNGWSTLLLSQTASALKGNSWRRVRGVAVRGGQLGGLITLAGLAIAVAMVMVLGGGTPAAVTYLTAILLAVILLFDQLSALRIALLRGMDHPVLAQIPDMLIRPVVLGSGLVVIVLFTSEPLALELVLCVLGLGSAIAFLAGARMLGRSAPAALKVSVATYDDPAWFRSAAVFTGTAAITVLNGHVDILLLAALVGADEVGQYRIALQVAVVSGLAYTSLNMIATQRFAALHASGNLEGLRLAATSFARLASLCAVPLPIVIFAAGDWLIPMIFGPRFSPALAPMLVLVVAQLVNAAAGMARSLLMMTGGERLVLQWSAIALVVNVALCTIIIPNLGGVGAALANAISLTVWNIALWVIAWRRMRVDTSVMGMV